MAKMSSLRTIRSASMPAEIDPLRCSSKDAHAAVDVKASMAGFNSSRSSACQPPSGVPSGVVCVTATCSASSGFIGLAGQPLPKITRVAPVIVLKGNSSSNRSSPR